VEVSGQLDAPAALSIGQEAGWAPEPVCTRWKREKIPIIALAGYWTPTVQPKNILKEITALAYRSATIVGRSIPPTTDSATAPRTRNCSTPSTGNSSDTHSQESTEGVTKSFQTESIMKYTLTFGITRWEATQRVMEAKLTTLAHKTAIQLHLVVENCTIRSPRSRRPVRELLDTR
jgi:hypothetical protein